MNVLVTGGAGFIGSHFIDLLLSKQVEGIDKVLCLDLLTYAGREENFAHHLTDRRFSFVKGNIGDQSLINQLLSDHAIDWIVNFAAETHVDRSIEGPDAFIQTNVVDTHELLKASLTYFDTLKEESKATFRFLHVSTDEVYGSLEPYDPPFTEENQYQPNSPYSASKAASDHLVRAYHHTFGLPTLITNCSNNYGPRQFPEKLIPLMIQQALKGEKLPIYGDGLNVRDWLYVTDHCTGILRVLEKGDPGATYNIGGNCEKTNIEIVDTLCSILDGISPKEQGESYLSQKTFVTDRKGHDRRYAIDSSKMKEELNWSPAETFETGIQKTVSHYLEHQSG
ncbi:MAG: dTDP-glucose 4,6-dehydratase [Verrucomicrobia bacterium]|nr:dTDP-glucose 4,6-dehydratase [Verrucomicrobiota bacterium]